MRHAVATTEEKLRVLDYKVRQLRRMRRDVAQMLIALQKAAGDACPFLEPNTFAKAKIRGLPCATFATLSSRCARQNGTCFNSS